MQIVITDGYTLNPGDLSWKAFEELGDLVYYDRSAASEVAARCKDASIIITNKTPVTEAVMAAAPELQLVAVTATGYNVVEVDAAKKRGVAVCNVPGYGTYSVAQHAFALLLELTNRVGTNAASVAAGDWYRSADWCFTNQPLMELQGKTMGIIGLGKIGARVATIAGAFGMKILHYRGKEKVAGAVEVKLHELCMQADVISVHCPLTSDNDGFINKELLELMKPTALLVNTSRGQLINERHLADALQQHTIAGAALDVLRVEPPLPGHPLVGLANCIITPHTAWISREARQRVMEVTLQNVTAALKGQPQNVVNG